MDKAVFNVPEMSCSHCEKTIKSALSELQGVSNVAVDLKSKDVTVEYNAEKASVESMLQTIEDAGYEVV